MPANVGRRYVTRWDVLRWNPDWTDRDRQMIAAAIDAVADVIGAEPHMYLPPSETYIGVLVYGQLGDHYGDSTVLRDGFYRALTVYKGKLEWIGNGTKFTDELDETLFRGMEEGDSSSWGFVVVMQWHRLSTYGGRHTHRTGYLDEQEPVCPTCYLALPKAGTCDNCGA